jgi:tetratricopeptide (TPR) repeat protein
MKARLLACALLMTGAGVATVATGHPAHESLRAAPASLLDEADRLQADHRFDAAERTLERVLAERPIDPQARLMRAQIRLARGNPRGALADCLAIARALDALAATGCVGQARAALGETRIARAMVERALAGAVAPSATRSWVAGIAADLAEAESDRAAAERWHALAIADAGDAHYPQLAWREYLARREAEADRAGPGR